MRKMRLRQTAVGVILLCAVLLNIVACSTRVYATDLMEGITPNAVTVSAELGDGNAAATDFAVRLFLAAAEDGKNTLVSPLSVMCALAMTANGADGETLRQMESALGMSIEQLNLYLYSYISSLAEGERYKLSVANSIWFTDDEHLSVHRDFLQANADYFGAQLYRTPFNRQMLRDINRWVKSSTDGMITRVLDDAPAEAVMYLINALAFEAEWESVYKRNQVRDGSFTTENGTERKAEFMYSTLYRYLDDGQASGFIKYYSGGKYAFVALLPDEGVSVSDYLGTLDGETLAALLSSPQSVEVRTSIPRFETEYNTEMSELLADMGMTDAFDRYEADFSRLGEISDMDGGIWIGSVIHKTYIRVDERGTRAGAVTSVGIDGAASEAPDEYKTVYLDRPFVYMLIDCENNIPFFIGTMMDVDA